MKCRLAKRPLVTGIARGLLLILAIQCCSALRADDAAVNASGDNPSDGEAAVDSENVVAKGVQGADVPLLPGGELSEDHWTFISRDRESRLAGTWQLRQEEGEVVLVCRGEPYGYLKTTRAFADFHLRLEWRYPEDANGNSGILLHTNGQGKDKVWPTAIQVQLHQPVCGSIFPSGDARSDNEIRDVRDVCKAVNQWNSCEITSVAGRISVEMNGKRIGVVTGCQPDRGGIALQSEGSEVHFRRLALTVFGDTRSAPQPVSLVPCLCPIPGQFDADLNATISERPLTRIAGAPAPSIHGSMTYDVVHRDTLAADGYLYRARHRERVLLVPATEGDLSDRRGDLGSRRNRHLRH